VSGFLLTVSAHEMVDYVRQADAPPCWREMCMLWTRHSGPLDRDGAVIRTLSSAVEHHVDIVGVTGSIPVVSTIFACPLPPANPTGGFRFEDAPLTSTILLRSRHSHTLRAILPTTIDLPCACPALLPEGVVPLCINCYLSSRHFSPYLSYARTNSCPFLPIKS
jgi:hypothetical protein